MQSEARAGILLGGAMMMIFVLSCGGGQQRATSSSHHRCDAAQEPSMSESQTLPSGTAGGPNAWFEVKVTWAAPILTDNHLLLDGVEIPIVRITTIKPTSDTDHDPTAGRLITRKVPVGKEPKSAYSNIVSFRIPSGTPPGKRQLVFKTCGVAAPESVMIDVLPSPAPVITSMKVVRGEQWSTLFLKGSNLIGVEEVILVAADGSISTIANVTKIDDGEIRATLNGPGTYDVFVHSSSGLGGGPPNNSIVVR